VFGVRCSWEEALTPSVLLRAESRTCAWPLFSLLYSFQPQHHSSPDLPGLHIMVRHKKDNFSRGGKKFGAPRPRPVPRGDDEDAAGSSRPAFKAACWDMGHCDPKRCSGKRLMKLGLMRELHIGQRFPGVIVSYANPSFVAFNLLTD
jgi:Uncharacterized conserved protein